MMGVGSYSTDRKPEDYVTNGLLFCGTCNKAKQKRLHLCGSEKIVDVLCQCGKAMRDIQFHEQGGVAIHRLRTECFDLPDLIDCTFDKSNTPNSDEFYYAQQYANCIIEGSVNDMGLMFHGPVGTGKTFLAACIANALIDQGIPCLVTNIARLSNCLFGIVEGKNHFIDGLCRYKILVLDDFGSERNTEYVSETAFQIIDTRRHNKLPIIITTNLSLNAFEHPNDIQAQRLYGRLLEMCRPISVTGGDRRRPLAAKAHAHLDKLIDK